jgi:hypothetical protein
MDDTAVDEVIDVEVVTDEIGDVVTHAEVVDGELVPVESRADKAIAHAAEEAFNTSGIPDRDEFLSLAMQARVMSMSGIVPKALQGKPADTFIVLLTGRDLGIPVTAAINQIHVIDGKVSISPKLLNARLRSLKIGKVIPGKRDATMAEAIACDMDGTPLGPPVVYTMAMAKQAKLDGKNNWKTYPERMLWWRAVGYAVDDYFPEAGLGLYSPDELGAVTDADGNPIDPGTAPLPEGFAPAEPVHNAPADPADLDLIARTIAALPVDGRDKLRGIWKHRRLPAPHQLDGNQAAFAWAIIRPIVADAEKAGAMGAVMPSEPSEPDPATDAAPEPSDGVDEATDGPDDDVTAGAIAAVKLMPMRAVDAALNERLLTTTGSADDRRARLSMVMIREANEPLPDDPPTPY